MKTAAIYARVSSDKQKEENTIASQTAALTAFAAEQGYAVPTEWIFEDEGYSGASLIRPGLERVRDLAAEGELDCCAANKMSGAPIMEAHQCSALAHWEASQAACRDILGDHRGGLLTDHDGRCMGAGIQRRRHVVVGGLPAMVILLCASTFCKWVPGLLPARTENSAPLSSRFAEA